MHYSIFIPSVGNLREAKEKWLDLGLNELCRIAEDSSEEPAFAMASGKRPNDDAGGCYFGWTGRGADVDSRFEVSDRMKWRPCPPAGNLPQGAYWLGWDKENKPTPSDLLRWQGNSGSVPYQGHALHLPDGNEWHIPSAYLLPHDNKLNWETGKPERRVREPFDRYCEQAGKYALNLFNMEEEILMICRMFNNDPSTTGQALELEFEDAYEHAVLALSINYRVNAAICDILGLLTDESIVRICSASFDLHLIQEAVKKKTPPSPIGIQGGTTLSREELGF